MYRLIFLLILSPIFWQACKQANNDTASQTKTETPVTTVALPDTFDCRIYGKPQKGQSYWLKEKQMLFALAAQGDDINKFNKPLYRTFQVYTTWDCNMISYNSLPGFGEEPTPYILQGNTYESNNEVVCVQGIDEVYCYHARRKELLPPMFPKYLSPRPRTQDAGQPLGLTVMGSVLLGAEKGKGTFAFDLSDVKSPKPFFPKSEYKDPESQVIRQLFFVKEDATVYPVISDLIEGKIHLSKMDGYSKELSGRVIRDRKTGRFAIARIKGEQKPLLFDLKEKKRIEIPNNLIETTDVLSYLDSEFY
ncbi:MAG: hypothetical protein HKN16_05060 [Saprospiraceae bacterium]|nr:hypothetical protein [Saprospiraceae bacterium]